MTKRDFHIPCSERNGTKLERAATRDRAAQDTQPKLTFVPASDSFFPCYSCNISIENTWEPLLLDEPKWWYGLWWKHHQWV
nr:hypothetical protein Iba_chr10aCG4910 [Ipomoea batatas]